MIRLVSLYFFAIQSGIALALLTCLAWVFILTGTLIFSTEQAGMITGVFLFGLVGICVTELSSIE